MELIKKKAPKRQAKSSNEIEVKKITPRQQSEILTVVKTVQNFHEVQQLATLGTLNAVMLAQYGWDTTFDFIAEKNDGVEEAYFRFRSPLDVQFTFDEAVNLHAILTILIANSKKKSDRRLDSLQNKLTQNDPEQVRQHGKAALKLIASNN